MAAIETKGTATNWAALIEGCLVVGSGVMLLRKLREGHLPLYIHPRYTPLVAATAVVLLLIGVARLWQTGTRPEALRPRVGMYGLLLLPVLLGVLLPAKPAGSALIDPQQLNNVGQGYRGRNKLAGDDSRKWTLLDWTFARFILSTDEARGKPVDVIGFVYHAPNAPADEFYVVRYALACCVADRTGASLRVRYPNATTLSNDQWVRVTGTVDLQPSNGPPEFVVINPQVAPTAQPDEPYLYP